MPVHQETQYLPYATNQVFDLVADVAQYPEFLPWCAASRILERGEGYFIAELLIGYKNLREQYTSKVSLYPPSGEHQSCSIHVELIRGPFHHLQNDWQFVPKGEGTEVQFLLDFAFKNKMLDMLIGGFFTKASERMVEAFKERANKLIA